MVIRVKILLFMNRFKLLIIATCLFMYSSASFAQLYDVIVAKDGSGDYTTIQDAILSIRDYKPEGRQRILVRNGVYEEKVIVPIYKTNISLIGEDRDSTILVWHDHGNTTDPNGRFLSVVANSAADKMTPSGNRQANHRLGTFESYTLKVQGDGFEMENMTLINDAMTHFNPNWRQDHKNNAKVAQAVALHSEADRCVYRNCRILGFQDTVYTGSDHSRQIFWRCYIEGTVDYIFGPATVWFEQCYMRSVANGYVSAASTPSWAKYGYVFNRCTITAADDVEGVYLGRPWRAYASVIYKDCKLSDKVHAEGWNNWSDPSREATARYAEFNSRTIAERAADSKPVDVSQRASWARQLTVAEAKEISVDKVMSGFRPRWISNVWPVSFRDVHYAFFDENTDQGTRYVAKTLETYFTNPSEDAIKKPQPLDQEPLVIKLNGVDCTTFVEYMVAAILSRTPSPSEGDSIYTRFVQALRYRGGIRGDYSTRKHYLSEWISDGEQLGMFKEITSTLTGAKSQTKTINFMTNNVKFYPQLAASKVLVDKMREVEKRLSSQTTWYVPSAKLSQAYGQLRHGDIVAFVTSTAGLDTQHVGFVWWQDCEGARPQLLHASSDLGRVGLDVRDLEQYACDLRNCIGVRIIRL